MAIYKYNGVSQAAREIARVTSVHPCATPGRSRAHRAAAPRQQARHRHPEEPHPGSGAIRRSPASTRTGAPSARATSARTRPRGDHGAVPADHATARSHRHVDHEGEQQCADPVGQSAQPRADPRHLRPGARRDHRRRRSRHRWRLHLRPAPREQNAADLARSPGRTRCSTAQNATAAALATAAANGYTHGTGGVTVNVALTSTTVKVDITAPHANYFAGVVGQPTWDVSVTATALAGVPKKFSGVAPFILSQEIFDPDHRPAVRAVHGHVGVDFEKTTGQGSDVAPDASSTWRGPTSGRATSRRKDIKDALDGTAPDQRRPRDQRLHRAVRTTASTTPCSTATRYQPSINTDAGRQGCRGADRRPADVRATRSAMMARTTSAASAGWALFHVVSATKRGGGDEGTITGYFKTGITRSASADDVCAVSDTDLRRLLPRHLRDQAHRLRLERHPSID